MAKRAKKQAGREPAEGVEIARCEFDNGEVWRLFLRPSPHGFYNFKLAADGRAEHKANYWLAWNVNRSRLTAARDTTTLREHRPVLHQWLRELCADPALEPEDYAIAEPLDFDALIDAHGLRMAREQPAETGAQRDDFSDLIGA